MNWSVLLNLAAVVMCVMALTRAHSMASARSLNRTDVLIVWAVTLIGLGNLAVVAYHVWMWLS